MLSREDREREIALGFGGPAPSSAAKVPQFRREQMARPIYNGRGVSRTDTLHAQPVPIYHRIFGEFKDALAQDTPEPTPLLFQLSHELCICASLIYDSETDRREAMIPLLQHILGRAIDVETHTDKTQGDGSIRATVKKSNSTVQVAIFEFKNEIGTGGSDPSTQVAITARKASVQEKARWFAEILWRVVCSCALNR